MRKMVKHRDEYSPAELKNFLTIARSRLQQYEFFQQLQQRFLAAVWLFGIGTICIMLLFSLFRVSPNRFSAAMIGILHLLCLICALAYLLADRKLHCPACNADAINSLENYCPQCGNTFKKTGSLFPSSYTCHHCKQFLYAYPYLKRQSWRGKIPKNFSSKYCSCCGVQFSDRLIK